ncbi:MULTISPECIES: Blp family class II bacteriocin [Bacillus cereus group]|uniref:Blp family class II bacteriocin n=1 Tax=Bacillus cereus group TaxID=86661 RepID=UPI0018F5B9C1|nr:Blp family class II bacteriocin [Bacillus cereus group sp. BfR-BA-01423]MBJ8205607.1 Blp family class II bacteriocin [Bacillus cereus]
MLDSNLFTALSTEELEVDGGKKNWGNYAGETFGAVSGGAGVGFAIGGPAGAFLGGTYGGVAYAIGVLVDNN